MFIDKRYYESLEFKNWFGDSKAINAKGKPLILFHGTWGNFEVFNVPSHGVYFTDDCNVAETYGELIKVHLSMQAPLILDFEGESDMGDEYNIEDEVAYAKEENFDSLIVYNSFDGVNFLDQFVVFNSSQIRTMAR